MERIDFWLLDVKIVLMTRRSLRGGVSNVPREGVESDSCVLPSLSMKHLLTLLDVLFEELQSPF